MKHFTVDKNFIRNNSMQGAVAGTPGTPPTYWANTATQNGITREIVSVFTENGIDFIRLRFTGTPTGSGYYDISFDTAGAPASNGQTWAFGAFARLFAGSVAGLTNAPRVILYGTPGFSDNGLVSLTGLNSSIQRFSGTKTFSTAITGADPRFSFTGAAGVPVDFTIDIGWPQLELGRFATSPIRTTSTAVTRAKETISIWR